MIKEVSEAEERSHSGDESHRAGGSTEDLDGVITFTARKQNSKSLRLSVVEACVVFS